ncbi:hypothetical protein MTP99_008297 [Tenebrio molitor]|nr:hypothetical protein MTP99_008297 [Tenebrio molitor]
MDLVETTLKVVQDRNICQQSLTSYKQNIKEYEEYINQLKDNLQDTQLLNRQSTGILEINNFTKNAFNENCKIVKDLFGKVYSYVQQVQDKLCTIVQQETPLNDLYNENEKLFAKLETKFSNDLKLLEIMKKDSEDQLLSEADQIKRQIDMINEERKKYDELWKNIVDQYEDKHKSLQEIKVEVEILQDNIEMELQQQESLIREKKEIEQKMFEEINIELEVTDKMLEVEEGVFTISNKLKNVLEVKQELLQKQNEIQKKIEQIERECETVKTLIKNTEENNTTIIGDYENEIELYKNLIQENENILMSCKIEETKINNEIVEVSSKIAALNAEQSYRDIVGEEDCAGMESAEKLSEENEKLTTDAEKFLNMISNCENDIRQKERELQQLQSAPNLELLEIKEKIKTLEEETEKNLEIEKEIEEIEQSNKNLQQSVERYQTAIKDFDSKQIQIQNENDQYQKELKNLTIQCNAIDKEIQRLETSTQERINLVPTPPLKHRRSASQPEKRKRKVLDIESDSSVDGERLSYAEFMAKKKMLKENKKQKR